MNENALCDKHCAVIGVGNVGRVLVPLLQTAGDPARQITACDAVLECSAATAATFGVRTAASLFGSSSPDELDTIVPDGAVVVHVMPNAPLLLDQGMTPWLRQCRELRARSKRVGNRLNVGNGLVGIEVWIAQETRKAHPGPLAPLLRPGKNP